MNFRIIKPIKLFYFIMFSNKIFFNNFMKQFEKEKKFK